MNFKEYLTSTKVSVEDYLNSPDEGINTGYSEFTKPSLLRAVIAKVNVTIALVSKNPFTPGLKIRITGDYIVDILTEEIGVSVIDRLCSSPHFVFREVEFIMIFLGNYYLARGFRVSYDNYEEDEFFNGDPSELAMTIGG